MLNQEMINKLNEQMNLEFYSANLYLQMSAWCSEQGLPGAAAFFKSHSQEEMQHMHRLFDYLSDTGAMPRLGQIDAPSADYKSITHVLNSTYEHEKFITAEINKLAHLAITTQDYSTFNFLQWYVAEQHEEEKLFKSILDKLDMVGEDGKALFLLDKDLKGLAAANPV
ncbi:MULTISPECIES: non-heme ferritin [Photorhabdus]|uniref:Ferritin n=1 Tax=Photorhabdus luminescens subsp. sonorensis TaxID=1173677 RepID=A0A5C4RFL4_PHOLU|nr:MULTISPECIES: non-heme ferritin [Photorhabdus]MCW7550780.1 non-heme ferritin [Photorhabdus aballayi]TNH42756.1 non-heme ferritin [Photorhabdus luminescens subsp. sonorensis]